MLIFCSLIKRQSQFSKYSISINLQRIYIYIYTLILEKHLDSEIYIHIFDSNF